MAEFKRLPTQEELSRMLYQQQLTGRSTQDIVNENLAKGTTVNAIPNNLFQRMASGVGIAKDQVNKLGNAADLAKLFPGYTGQSQVNIPTGYNFAPKQAPTGEVMPQGLQTQQVNLNQLLQAIRPSDVLGLTGAQQAYTDVGMGKAPSPMDVLDIAGLGAAGLGAGKGLLGIANATKGLPVGMSIKDVGEDSVRIFRGSYDDSPSYKVEDNFKGEDAYGGVFGSGRKQSAESFGNGNVHYADIPKKDILTNYALNYDTPYKDVKKALLKAKPDISKEYFDAIYKIVVEDKGSDLRNVPDDVISQFGSDVPNNEVQRLRGQVAKNLGYKAIEMGDETGTSYLVTPGTKFTKIENEIELPKYPQVTESNKSVVPPVNSGISRRKRGFNE